MEKFSSFDRVVGKISESEKEQILRDKAERFDDQVFEDLEGKEREKTPTELEILFLVNDATNEIRRKYGLEDFDIPPDNIHLISEEKWPREKSNAFFNSMLQGIAMRERSSNLAFAKTSFHEMVHFKSYNALQVTIGENPKLEEYRLGLTVSTRQASENGREAGEDLYFVNLNEAITEGITKRYAAKLFSSPIFVADIKQTKDIINRHPQALSDSGQPLFDNETFYAEEMGKKTWGEAVGRLFGKLFGSNIRISTECFTYERERDILQLLTTKILERNPEKFQDSEEVFEVFAKGMMTGNILPVGRLIEETFGVGTFRHIGELDRDIEAQMAFVQSL